MFDVFVHNVGLLLMFNFVKPCSFVDGHNACVGYAFRIPGKLFSRPAKGRIGVFDSLLFVSPQLAKMICS